MSVVFVHTNLKKQKAMFWPQKISYDILLGAIPQTAFDKLINFDSSIQYSQYMLYFVIILYILNFFRDVCHWNLQKNWLHSGQKCLDWFFYISHVQRLLTSLQMSTKNQMCLNDVLIVTLVSPHCFKFAFVSFFAL